MKKKILILILALIILLTLSFFLIISNNKPKFNIKDKEITKNFVLSQDKVIICNAKLVKYNNDTNDLEYIEPSLKIQSASKESQDNIINICKKVNIDYKLKGDNFYFNSLEDKVKIQHLRIMSTGIGVGRITIIKYRDKLEFLYHLPVIFDKKFLKNPDDAIYKDILTDEDLTDEAVEIILDTYKYQGNIDENRFKHYDEDVFVKYNENRNCLILADHTCVMDSTRFAYLINSGCDIVETNGNYLLYNY